MFPMVRDLIYAKRLHRSHTSKKSTIPLDNNYQLVYSYHPVAVVIIQPSSSDGQESIKEK